MTTISSASSAYAGPASTSIQDYSNVQLDRSQDQDGDAASSLVGQSHRHHRGGHMHDAVQQALSSLGLNAATPSGNPAQTSTTAQDGDADDAGKGGMSIRQDMHDFMHALFQAVKSEANSASSAGAPSTGTAGSSDPGSPFGSRLNTLITDVSNGNAPSDLQNAFNKLVSDMQTSSNSAGAPANGSASTGTQAQITLQEFLSKLQSNLGYGASGSSASGSILSATA